MSITVAQVDRGNQGFFMNGQTPFTNIPDLSITFIAGGGPIEVYVCVSLDFSSGSAISLRAAIDGVPVDAAFTNYNYGSSPGEQLFVQFQRVYLSVSKGTHIFTAQASNPNSPGFTISQGWFIVKQL